MKSFGKSITFLIFGISTLFYTNSLFSSEVYQLSLDIRVLDDQNREFEVKKDQDLQFRILSERGWAYEIEIIESDGTPREGRFLTSRQNVDAAFVVSDFEAITQITREAGEPPRPSGCIGREDCDELPPRPVLSFGSLDTPLETEEVSSDYPDECLVEGTDTQWRENCAALFDSNIPEDALRYALQVLKNNATEFRTSECYRTQNSSHYSMRGVTRSDFERRMENGLPNKCQLVINDTRSRWSGNRGLPYRGNMYFIDLCKGDEPEIHHDYFNLGTGTGANRTNWRNQCRQRNTNMGAFFTNYKSFSFANNNAAYQRAAREQREACRRRQRQGLDTHVSECRLRKSSVQLMGLQNTNSTAAQCNKYMHISPYNSSWGCPSIRPENYWMIEQLAENGPSLVLNYHDDLEPLSRCETPNPPETSPIPRANPRR